MLEGNARARSSSERHGWELDAAARRREEQVLAGAAVVEVRYRRRRS